MKRSELIVKMVRCWDTSKGMGYTNIQAMDRVLEIAEENGMMPPYNPIVGSKEENEGHIFNCQWTPE